MAIPRDRVCWYCARGEHDRCGVPKTCACRTCYRSLFVLDCRPLTIASLLKCIPTPTLR